MSQCTLWFINAEPLLLSVREKREYLNKHAYICSSRFPSRLFHGKQQVDLITCYNVWPGGTMPVVGVASKLRQPAVGSKPIHTALPILNPGRSSMAHGLAPRSSELRVTESSMLSCQLSFKTEIHDRRSTLVPAPAATLARSSRQAEESKICKTCPTCPFLTGHKGTISTNVGLSTQVLQLSLNGMKSLRQYLLSPDSLVLVGLVKMS
ncbi:hypothetical protein PO909_029129 [Leuciscus waleckii]